MKRVSVMSIIKVELRLKELAKVVEAFKVNRRSALEALSQELKRELSAASSNPSTLPSVCYHS